MKYLLSILMFIILKLAYCENDIKLSTTTTTSTTTTLDDYRVQEKIVNKHDFEYILNPGNNICNQNDPNSKVYMLVYVHTSPDNFKRRLSLRETWARRSMFRDMRIVFMMGDVEDKKTKSLLNLESNLYQDIVQENFLDAYRNLTYKGIMAMKWISEYCKNAQYILKVDDDILSNVFILLKHLNSMETHKIVKQKTIMCLVWVGMVVMREPNSKWYLSKDEFKDDVYGKYCSGSAYIFTNDLPKDMYNASQYIKFFWVDDYYITGLLARGVNVSYEFFNSLYIISTNLVEQRFVGPKTSDHTVFGHLPGDLNKLYNLWNFILQNQLNHFPNLLKGKASLIKQNDFIYLKNFQWQRSIWDKFLKPPEVKTEIEKNNFNLEAY